MPAITRRRGDAKRKRGEVTRIRERAGALSD